MPAESGQHPEQLDQQRDHQRADHGRGAVARQRREQQADADDRRDRNRGRRPGSRRRARAPLGAETIVPDRLWSAVEPRLDAAGDDRHRPVEQDRDHRIGRGDERLAGEDLMALERAREHRLERAVVILGGEDVTGHERDDQREHPDRAEQQDHERHRQAAAREVVGEREVAVVAIVIGWN